MPGRQPEPVMREVSDAVCDDIVLPFAVEQLDIRGRLVRLGPSISCILSRHDYPAPVARLVAEAAALTALMATALKFEGQFQLQARGDGAVSMLIVDFDFPDRLRALARFKPEMLADADRRKDLLGIGHLAVTIDPGGEMTRHQGIAALRGQGLEDAAYQYFRHSAQIPARVRLAAAEDISGAGRRWRAGGLMIQLLPPSARQTAGNGLKPGSAPLNLEGRAHSEQAAWAEAASLAATIEDHELVDPALSSERLLYRLFHRHGVKVFSPQPVREACRCSDERITALLRGFSPQERQDMTGDDGKIGVTCEFCSAFRAFDPKDFDS
ncbi:MAG TPA: Hsp33 family molecular chaperone [Methylocella sp.]|nr:Hsp33 family molecular chaperone [Methylocella sp.]